MPVTGLALLDHQAGLTLQVLAQQTALAHAGAGADDEDPAGGPGAGQCAQRGLAANQHWRAQQARWQHGARLGPHGLRVFDGAQQFERFFARARAGVVAQQGLETLERSNAWIAERRSPRRPCSRIWRRQGVVLQGHQREDSFVQARRRSDFALGRVPLCVPGQRIGARTPQPFALLAELCVKELVVGVVEAGQQVPGIEQGFRAHRGH